MRNIDLDQFWPQLHPRPAEVHETSVGRASHASQLSVAEPIAPPPLPAGPQAEPVEPPPDLIAAAFAGWVAPMDVHVTEPGLEPGARESATSNSNFTPELVSDGVTDEVPVPARAPMRRKPDFTAVVWGGSGFIAGMLAWHMVGFWSFVSNVVLNADDPRARTLDGFLPQIAASEPVFKATSRVPAAGKALTEPSETKTRFACVALTSDRTTGGTRLTGCRGSVAHLRDAGFNKRTDKLILKPRLQDPVAWTGSTAVNVSDIPAEPQRQEPVASSQSGSSPSAGTDTSRIETGSLRDSDLKLDLTQPELTGAQ